MNNKHLRLVDLRGMQMIFQRLLSFKKMNEIYIVIGTLKLFEHGMTHLKLAYLKGTHVKCI
jgi:hypothetical protein